jgi:hypothetical protein
MNGLLRPWIWRPSGHPRVLAPATYHSGTFRNQHPVVTRLHTHLRGLATAVHEISGLASQIAHLRFTRGRAKGADIWLAESHKKLQSNADLAWEGEAQTI